MGLVKYCPKCQKYKYLVDFYRRKTGIRSGEYYEKCKECMKSRGRYYYRHNHDRQLALKLAINRKNYYLRRNIMIKIKSQPCKDCSNLYPYFVMDFDHRDRKSKVDSPARLRSYSFKKFMDEIKKCDIVCSNCHRIRTFKKYL
ncbi:hypothetical protein A2V80_02715 [Candidatus Woesebacteria bacterium RBG_16_39_8b]|uniref:HNH domain-containing protein n=1 Tax=Candidatus Woesebacteria bacterium RBG_16_39_8b TaxID=1802482 RepID=A0A1F7XB91_9BACT|nr:MAG: hypothetical protein A2V80_02715 [Candidatus Woesebacteria bacterium RBG_16_39_8b]